MGDLTFFKESHLEAIKLIKWPVDDSDPSQQEAYWQARKKADKIINERGVCETAEVNCAFSDLLNLSIDDAIKSDNPIIRAFATLDRRFGKRRLASFDDSNEHDLVKTLFRFRCKVEGIEMEPS
jgi:hypothetical protein